ncbi:MAG: ATP-grasp domain-containing protein [Coriobacteriales bacterium]|jgi:D-alanine-D-alanine ligase|nr:ATP-grasp domain-containing protein [Coriobacteriales bacterium]
MTYRTPTPLTVALLCGGVSNERAISLVSAAGVRAVLEASGHKVVVVDTGKCDFIHTIAHSGADVAFIALHGTGGEDGSIQGVLELLRLPYTGSGVLASALAMDKHRSKLLYRVAGLSTPEAVVLRGPGAGRAEVLAAVGGAAAEGATPAEGAAAEGATAGGAAAEGAAAEGGAEMLAAAEAEVLAAVGVPCVIKPVCEGSSVGITIVRRRDELAAALSDCFGVCDLALAEAFVAGTEITISVIGHDELLALPIIEIISNAGEFYDYQSKYAEGGSTHIIPARISPAAAAAAREAALVAHRMLDCSGVSRTDMIVDEDDVIWLIETNTIPGMTPTSLLPEAARAAGIEPAELYDRLLFWALERAAPVVGRSPAAGPSSAASTPAMPPTDPAPAAPQPPTKEKY